VLFDTSVVVTSAQTQKQPDITGAPAMNNALTPSLLARLRPTRRRAVRAQEPADLGTAFGMEQWLDEIAGEPPVAVVVARRPGGSSWWPRWLQGGTAR
jgi:hypothetical protein